MKPSMRSRFVTTMKRFRARGLARHIGMQPHATAAVVSHPVDRRLEVIAPTLSK
jgi:hypothetical protein